MSTKIKHIDLIVGLLSVGVALYVFIESASFPLPHQSQLGAAVFPRILVILLVVLGLWISATGMKRKEDATIHHIKEVVLCLFGLIFYGAAIKPLGFLITTPIFIIFTLYILGVRRITSMIIISVGTTGTIFFIFRFLLSVPLPPGIIAL